MWRLYLTAKGTGSRPSDLIGVADRWAALMFDNAVTMVGAAIENAAQEQEKVGQGKDATWRAKYSLAELLDPDFRLPAPPKAASGRKGQPVGNVLLGWIRSQLASGAEGFKLYKLKN